MKILNNFSTSSNLTSSPTEFNMQALYLLSSWMKQNIMDKKDIAVLNDRVENKMVDTMGREGRKYGFTRMFHG